MLEIMKRIFPLIAITASTVIPVYSKLKEGNNPCFICGTGKEVGSLDHIFAFPGQQSIPCGKLQELGLNGELPETQCVHLPEITTKICNCQPFKEIGRVDFNPIKIPNKSCSICGEKKGISNPSAIFVFPAQPPISCRDLEIEGKKGFLEEGQCSILPSLIANVCGCAQEGTRCAVCGEGNKVGNPDASFAFESQPKLSCADLQENGERGVIAEDQCVVLSQEAAKFCGCEPVMPSCAVCGEGKEVGNRDALYAFPAQPTITCGALEENGENGEIAPDECSKLPELVSAICECKSIMPPTNSSSPIAPAITSQVMPSMNMSNIHAPTTPIIDHSTPPRTYSPFDYSPSIKKLKKSGKESKDKSKLKKGKLKKRSNKKDNKETKKNKLKKDLKKGSSKNNMEDED